MTLNARLAEMERDEGGENAAPRDRTERHNIAIVNRENEIRISNVFKTFSRQVKSE